MNEKSRKREQSDEDDVIKAVEFRPRRSTYDSPAEKRSNKSSTFKAEEGKSKNRKTFCFESPGSSQKSNPSQYIMGNESKNIVVMRKEGSLETIQIRGVSFSEDKEQSMKSSVMLKKRSKDSNSVVVDNEEQAETEDAFGSEDGDEGTLLKAFLTEEGKKLSEAMNLAKQLTLKIDKKYLLKIKKKEVLREHLMMIAALRKLFAEGTCTEKAPMNPIKKDLWKKWCELSELGDAERRKLKPKFFEHLEAATDIFFNDPDFAMLVAKYSRDFSQLKELCAHYTSLVASRTPKTLSGPKISTTTAPNPADVDAFMRQFAEAQMEVTKTYLRLMESVRTRWNNSNSDILSREETARKTRDDLLTIQEQLIKYQNSIMVYQSDVNALWQIMIDHQQVMNNDFSWDMVESINDDESEEVQITVKGKNRSAPKRFVRFFSKKLGSGSRSKAK